MSDLPSIDDLRVNPFRGPEKQLYAKAKFSCPHCGEEVEMVFTESDIKGLLLAYQKGMSRGPPR